MAYAAGVDVGSTQTKAVLINESREIVGDLVPRAILMADIAHIGGLVAAGLHPSPIPSCEFVTMTTHKTLRGPRGGLIMCKKQFAEALDIRIFPGMQGGPLMHIIAAKAVAFHEAMKPSFTEYQRAILDNALVLATELQRGGLRLVTGGTDNHMVLVDLTQTGVTGKQAEAALGAVGIVVNRNAIPFDPRPHWITSGVRLGTPAVTSRGFGKEEVKFIAAAIVRVISNIGDQKALSQVKEEVTHLCSRFPVPGIDE